MQIGARGNIEKELRSTIEAGLDKENIGEIIVPRDLMDNPFTVLLDGKKISHKVSDTTKTSVITVIFDGKGKHTLEITLDETNGGGCLIATASFTVKGDFFITFKSI